MGRRGSQRRRKLTRAALVQPSAGWGPSIGWFAARRSIHIHAETYLDRLTSFSKPARFVCSDKNEWLVKALQPTRPDPDEHARGMVTDQVIGYLANVMHAPVPPVRLVEVPLDVIEAQPELRGDVPHLFRIEAGPGHGSLWHNGWGDRQNVSPPATPAQRERYCRLALLYGLAGAADHQVLYDGTGLVWSVDHGHFLPGSTKWTAATLSSSGSAAPDPVFLNFVSMPEVVAQLPQLALITDTVIARAVSRPARWGITRDERIALAEYVARRRDDLLALGAP